MGNHKSKPTIGGIRPRADGTYDYINDISETNRSLREWAAQYGKHQLVVIDRPWAYKKKKGSADHSGDAGQQYPCIEDDALAELDIRSVMDTNAIVAEWVPRSQVPLLLSIWQKHKIRHLGNTTWLKVSAQGGVLACRTMGLVSAGAEDLYIGRVGSESMTPDAALARLQAVYHLERKRHSEKPQAIHDALAELLRGFVKSKAELFCREPKRGWNVWGNQSDGAHAAAARAHQKRRAA